MINVSEEQASPTLFNPEKPKYGHCTQRKLFFSNDKLKNIERYDFVVEAIRICVIELLFCCTITKEIIKMCI